MGRRPEEPVMAFEITHCVTDKSPDYSIQKTLSDPAPLRALGSGAVRVVGTYGHYDSCKKYAEALFESSLSEMPSLEHGIVGLYSETQKLLLLWIVDKKMEDYAQAPINRNSMSVQLVSYLLDLSQLVVVFPTTDQIEHWYCLASEQLNPFNHTSFTIVEHEYRTVEITPQIEQVALHSEDSVQLTRDWTWMAFTKESKPHDYSEDIEKVREKEEALVAYVVEYKTSTDEQIHSQLRCKVNDWWNSLPKNAELEVSYPEVKKDLVESLRTKSLDLQQQRTRVRRVALQTFLDSLVDTFEINPILIDRRSNTENLSWVRDWISRQAKLNKEITKDILLRVKPYLRPKDPRHIDANLVLNQYAENYIHDTVSKTNADKRSLADTTRDKLRHVQGQLVPEVQTTQVKVRQLLIDTEDSQAGLSLRFRPSSCSFSIIRPTTQPEEISMVCLESKQLVVQFSSATQTGFYLVNPSFNLSEEQLPYTEDRLQLVPGSTSGCFVVINHTKRTAYINSLNNIYCLKTGFPSTCIQTKSLT
jgi:hypothetical protein